MMNKNRKKIPNDAPKYFGLYSRKKTVKRFPK